MSTVILSTNQMKQQQKKKITYKKTEVFYVMIRNKLNHKQRYFREILNYHQCH